LPFSRDETAFFLLLTAPRQAGQKLMSGTWWIEHFGAFLGAVLGFGVAPVVDASLIRILLIGLSSLA
jgi:hypothetical protein